MKDTYDINRADFLLLSTIYAAGCTSYYSSMTITEIMSDNSDADGNCPLKRLTVYRKLQKLEEHGYIKKGIRDDHADTYYVLEKTIGLIENGGKNK